MFKLAAAVATGLWGFTYIITTTMLPQHPWFIGAVRAGLGALPLLLLARELPPLRFWPKLIVLGTLNAGLFFGLLFIAALRLPGGVASIFQALSPLFAVALVWPLLGQRPTVMKVAGLLVGLVGVVLVVLKGGAGLDLLGVLAALGCALSVALGGILVQKWGQPMSMAGFTAWQLVVAAVGLGAVALILDDVPVSLTAVNGLGLAILAFGLTSLPFFLWFKAIRKEGAASVAPFMLLTPIIAFVLDAIVRGILPTPLQGLGGLLVIAGLILNIGAGRKNRTKVPVQPVEVSEKAVTV
ncbi:MAG: permease [Alphaproteobacteria bacterium]|nr:MAG: permease [Alphaproteobacteria bacterium]